MRETSIAQMIAYLRRSMTFAEIASACGFASPGHVHNALSRPNVRMAWQLAAAVRAEYERQRAPTRSHI